MEAARGLFTLNLRDDVRVANARGKMQKAGCEMRNARSPDDRTGPGLRIGSARGERREGKPAEGVSGRVDRLESKSAGLYNLSNCSSLCFPLLSATQRNSYLALLYPVCSLIYSLILSAFDLRSRSRVI